MEILHETTDVHKKTFFNHVFSQTEEGKAANRRVEFLVLKVD
jgi:hypothetical protein